MIIFAIMLQKIKHIASGFLILIFLFPVLYQFQHVVLLPGMHHSDSTQQCCGHDHCNTAEAEENPVTGSNENNFEQDQDQCQVCEFHYAVIHYTHKQNCTFATPTFSSQHALRINHPFLTFQGYSRSLRAPPFFLSFV